MTKEESLQRFKEFASGLEGSGVLDDVDRKIIERAYEIASGDGSVRSSLARKNILKDSAEYLSHIALDHQHYRDNPDAKRELTRAVDRIIETRNAL